MTEPTSSKPTPKHREKKIATAEAEALRAKLEAAVDFPGTAREALHDLRAAGKDAVTANQASLDGFDSTLSRTLGAIEKELDRSDFSPAERLALIDKMVEVAKMRDVKDTENKRFLSGLTQDRMKAALYVAGGVAMVAIAAVTGPDGLKQLGKLAPQVAKKAIAS